MNQFHRILFDRDNTLLYFDQQAVHALALRISSVVPQANTRQAIRLWNTWQGEWPRTIGEEEDFWRTFWITFGTQYGCQEHELQALAAIGNMYHTVLQAYDDAFVTCAALRAQKYSLAVLTNFELPSIAATLDHAGIPSTWFDHLTSTSSLHTKKPYPDAWRQCLSRMGWQAQSCVVIEDNRDNARAAALIGCRSWIVDRHAVASDPASGVLATLLDIPSWLEQDIAGIV